MAKLDFKITCWERVDIPDEIRDEVLEKLQKGEITSANGLFQAYPGWDLQCEQVLGTDVQISPEENDGRATIEFNENDGNWTEIFNNATK